VLLLESGDVLHGNVELMGDPGVGAPLANPCPDLIELGFERSTCQSGAETT
jgi:hypothetical protein